MLSPRGSGGIGGGGHAVHVVLKISSPAFKTVKSVVVDCRIKVKDIKQGIIDKIVSSENAPEDLEDYFLYWDSAEGPLWLAEDLQIKLFGLRNGCVLEFRPKEFKTKPLAKRLFHSPVSRSKSLADMRPRSTTSPDRESERMDIDFSAVPQAAPDNSNKPKFGFTTWMKKRKLARTASAVNVERPNLGTRTSTSPSSTPPLSKTSRESPPPFPIRFLENNEVKKIDDAAKKLKNSYVDESVTSLFAWEMSTKGFGFVEECGQDKAGIPAAKLDTVRRQLMDALIHLDDKNSGLASLRHDLLGILEVLSD